MDSKFVAARAVVFVHIPKTAGTSFTQFLELSLGEVDGRLNLGEHPKKELFCGHQYLRIAYTSINNGYFVTVLRNPIDRTISQYRSIRNKNNYTANWRDLYTKEQVAALEFCRNATFSEVIHCTNAAVLAHFVNVQTRILSDHQVELRDLISPYPFQKRILDSANENLVKKINFFGIYEMMYSSLAMFKRETGVNGTIGHLNESAAYPIDLSSRDLAKLRDLLDLDFQLYESALKVFHRRMRDWLADSATRPMA